VRSSAAMSSRADDCVLVIFGASGDLTRRKLLPAIYNLAEAGHLPEHFAIVGVARPPIEQQEYRTQMRDRVTDAEGEPLEPAKWKPLEERLYYVSGEFHDKQLYTSLADTLRDVGSKYSIPPNYLFYFAIPPDLFADVADQLAASGLATEGDGWRRVIVEKPFGYDLETARALNARLSVAFDESQIYRIDHYLGKETVQNILAFRFANGIFEPIWNRRYVSHVQMTVAEVEGIGSRGAYYDKVGALRDIVQNHMFQLLTLVAMEPPISFAADAVRDEKVKVLRAVPPPTGDAIARDLVRGQYDGYTREPNVAPDSRTGTFVAMRLLVDNWRWAGVPFYLRTGKRLARRVTEVALGFKRAPHLPFAKTDTEELGYNAIVLRIQPDEGVTLRFGAKVPGTQMEIRDVNMDFAYGGSFTESSPEAYERLLLDVLLGDPPLFPQHEEVELSWDILDPILDYWADLPDQPEAYEPGSWGPKSADLMLARDGFSWRRP
jgi:glucose-6-phosphate 1-dehydrogenase